MVKKWWRKKLGNLLTERDMKTLADAQKQVAKQRWKAANAAIRERCNQILLRSRGNKYFGEMSSWKRAWAEKKNLTGMLNLLKTSGVSDSEAEAVGLRYEIWSSRAAGEPGRRLLVHGGERWRRVGF